MKKQTIWDQYSKQLPKWENSVNAGLFNEKYYPYEAVEDQESLDIGFGHKLTPEELKTGQIFGTGESSYSYLEGLTRDQMLDVMERDIETHRGEAKRIYDNKFGKGKWGELDDRRQAMLTDIAYTGVLPKFPKFMGGIYDDDEKIIGKQYKRYTQGKPLARNRQFANLFSLPFK